MSRGNQKTRRYSDEEFEEDDREEEESNLGQVLRYGSKEEILQQVSEKIERYVGPDVTLGFAIFVLSLTLFHDVWPRTIALIITVWCFLVFKEFTITQGLAKLWCYKKRIVIYTVGYLLGAVFYTILRLYWFSWKREGIPWVHKNFDVCREIDLEDEEKRFSCYIAALQFIQEDLLIWFVFWPFNLVKTIVQDPITEAAKFILDQLQYMLVWVLDKSGGTYRETIFGVK